MLTVTSGLKNWRNNCSRYDNDGNNMMLILLSLNDLVVYMGFKDNLLLISDKIVIY